MNSHTISGSAQRFAEIVQRDPALRAAIEARPESLLIFVRALTVASRMSSRRTAMLDAVTDAADSCDRVLEAMNDGVQFDAEFDLVGRLITAGQSLDHLGKMLADVDPSCANAVRVTN